MFLAIVLITGTIVLSSPLFMTIGAQASSDREKDRDNDDKKKSYGKDRDRDDESRDHDKYDNDDKKSYVKYNDESSDEEKYNDDDKKSYGKDRERYDKSRDHTDDKTQYDYESTKSPSDYTDNRYNSYEPDYGMDNDYKDRYGKDSYELQYSSYGKDNSDYKSKDSSSVSIKKVKCNNINVNVNGLELNGLPPVLSGLLSNGERDEGQYGASSYGSYSDGVQQSDYDNNNSFKFVCINNNNNTVIGSGNETTPGRTLEPTPEEECEKCFRQNLNSTQFAAVAEALAEGVEINIAPGVDIEVNSFEEFCDIVKDLSFFGLAIDLNRLLIAAEITILDEGVGQELAICIAIALGIDINPPTVASAS